MNEKISNKDVNDNSLLLKVSKGSFLKGLWNIKDKEIISKEELFTKKSEIDETEINCDEKSKIETNEIKFNLKGNNDNIEFAPKKDVEINERSVSMDNDKILLPLTQND